MVFGTHHKAGTVLMQNIATGLSSLLGLPLHVLRGRRVSPPDGWRMVRDTHSAWLMGLPAATEDIRAVHIVRDPRMIPVSSALYHLHSKEEWLHRPDEAFGGLTYQQYLKSLPDDKSRFSFELEQGAASRTLTDMEVLSRTDQPWRLDVKLEVLMTDTGLETYTRIFEHLGLAGAALDRALGIAFEHSVFNAGASRTSHVRSATPEDWRDYLSPEQASSLESRHPGLRQRLGYAGA